MTLLMKKDILPEYEAKFYIAESVNILLINIFYRVSLLFKKY